MLVGTFLEDGTLVQIGGGELAAEDRYNVIVPVKAKRSNARDLAAAWLTASLHG